jgi:hypothetical protein
MTRFVVQRLHAAEAGPLGGERVGVATRAIEGVERPPILQFGLELPRTVAEGALFLAAEAIMRIAREGDRHPALVLPGFLADDRATIALRWHLSHLGYAVHGWCLGRNLGPTKEAFDGMRRALNALASEHEKRVSVIGWSLGGIYAHELARTDPSVIREVITLGSPLRLAHLRQTRTERMWGRYQHLHDERFRVTSYSYVDDYPSVPSTAIYSRSDGIVAWRTCLLPTGPSTENIEVWGSHCGLGHNAAAVYAITDRLARPEGGWRPFEPWAPLRWLYPRPHEADAPEAPLAS